MIYLLGVLIAAMIVTGQVLWKTGIDKSGFIFEGSNIFSLQLVKTLFSPYILLGVLSYGVATILYMALLSKYEYTSLQAVVVSSSLVATFIASSLIFSEKISSYNLLGLCFLLVGVVLITKL